MAGPLVVYRTEPGGAKSVVGVCGDWSDVGPMIYADRDGIDWEASYVIEPEEGHEPERNDPRVS